MRDRISADCCFGHRSHVSQVYICVFRYPYSLQSHIGGCSRCVPQREVIKAIRRQSYPIILLNSFPASGCRFASDFTTEQLLSSADARQQLLELVFRQEGRFAKVGLADSTATTYDGTELDWDSGKPTQPLHTFSAPSKESLHIMVLTHVLKGGSTSKLASLFVEPDSPVAAFASAIDQLERKIAAYQSFNKRFPGYGTSLISDHGPPVSRHDRTLKSL
jgi:hypothetical protein